MFSDKAFRIALGGSLLLHGALFFRMPYLGHLSSLKVFDPIDITYIEKKLSDADLKSLAQKLPAESSSRITTRETFSPALVEKDQIFKKAKNISPEKPDFVNPEIIPVKKQVTLPALSDEKLENPQYLNYYQLIREKIRKTAYANYNRQINGAVYLSFVIARNGQLKELRADEGKMLPHPYLKNVALTSIRAASPFPEFPPDLDYSQLSFNVIILFQLE